MKLCVALDHAKYDANLALAKALRKHDIWLKVGFRSFIRDGRSLLEALKEINPDFKIFLDLKLYDIPNTMADAAEEIAKLGVEMFNIHASSGKKAMRGVMERLEKLPHRPLVLAVTALTSFDDATFRDIYGADIRTKARQFSNEAYESGLDGVVCSVYESAMIKNDTAEDFLTLTPGIRPFGEAAADQKRVADLQTAKEERVDFIVVGRPIYRAENPGAVVEKILSQI